MMRPERLAEILSGYARTRVLLVGDFFLDRYLEIDRSLAEVSLETGLEAHQVVRVRASPGAAGTVASNLRALDVGVVALGVVGDDGEGYELLRGLRERGVETDALISTPHRRTPTYTKPMLREVDGRVHELSRLDIKNRAPLDAEVESAIIDRLRAVMSAVQGVVVADQVPERNCGVITDRVRAALAELGAQYRGKPVVVDSRVRIGEFAGVMLKPNERELLGAMGRQAAECPPLDVLADAGRGLATRCGKAVFVTVGERGILLCTPAGTQHIAAVRVKGPIDIVGAGDSTMAGIVSALSNGAALEEAALVGNLVASVTIRSIGTTGTATQAEVVEALGRWSAN